MGRLTHVFPAIWPGGGPPGYGYYLQEALSNANCRSSVQILSPVYPFYASAGVDKIAEENVRVELKERLKRISPTLYGYLVVAVGYLKFKKALSLFTKEQISELKGSSALIFHDWRLAYLYLSKIGRQSGQKVFLMPHSPVEWSREYVDSLTYSFGRSALWNVVYKFYLRLEVETWKASCGVIVPSRYSLESYFMNTVHKPLIDVIPVIEVPTGVKPLEVSRPIEETRRLWGVPPGVFVIGFYGRKHPHKGYDLFVQLAREALKCGDHRFVFISAGSGPLSYLKAPNLIDLGYVNKHEIGNAIAACDLIVAPNRVNYFDLMILEAMSLGKVVITTKVGGVKSIVSPGLILLEPDISARDILSIICELVLNPGVLRDLGEANIGTYQKQFTLSAFAERHCLVTREILEQ